MNIVDNNNLSCYNFSRDQFDGAQYAKGSVALLGIVASVAVIFLIFVSKSHKHFIFRLVIYFMLANIFQGVAHILALIPVHYDDGGGGGAVEGRDGEGWCTTYGFLDQVTMWMRNMAILWIMFYMLWLTHQLKRLQNGEQVENIQFYKNPFRVELIGVFILFLFPLTFNWIPFCLSNMYGLSGLWCWIKESKSGKCTIDNTGLA